MEGEWDRFKVYPVDGTPIWLPSSGTGCRTYGLKPEKRQLN